MFSSLNFASQACAARIFILFEESPDNNTMKKFSRLSYILRGHRLARSIWSRISMIKSSDLCHVGFFLFNSTGRASSGSRREMSSKSSSSRCGRIFDIIDRHASIGSLSSDIVFDYLIVDVNLPALNLRKL